MTRNEGLQCIQYRIELWKALIYAMIAMVSAAESLEGRSLSSGWLVKRKMPSSQNNSRLTGGCFSVGYEVEKDGQIAFLKALDFHKAFVSATANSNPNPAAFMQHITAMFTFEQSILETCRDANIQKVVRLLDSGVEIIAVADQPNQTQYLIFEWAESDVRRKTIDAQIFDPSWALRCMHAITSGLYHLHDKGIIHQDIKPSNILLFPENDTKIGDFGTAYSSHKEAEHNKNHFFPGDKTYVPPECLYQYATGNEEMIRKGADVYMLGSMLHFFFMRTPLTPTILAKLPAEYHPEKRHWAREQIVPYLRSTYDLIVEEFTQAIHEEFQNELADILRQLTDPEPEKRGHPSNRRARGNNLSLERYVSIFDRLSRAYLHRYNKG